MAKAQDIAPFTHDITICVHTIISTVTSIMMKAQKIATFFHDITICEHSILSSASNIMMKSQDIATFAYDITICSSHNIYCIQYKDESTVHRDVCP